jgi:Glycosyltransferase
VLYTGRLEPGKGLETLIDAWGLLPKDSARLLILGTGSLEGTLKSRASRDERIIFPGWKENAADYVKAADIFVLPSFGEGLPVSLLEAMSCGLACVSTQIGGVTELIRNGENGVLVKPGEPEALAGELKKLINDPAARERLGKAARVFVENNMSMEKVTATYAELYLKLTGRSGAIK